MAGLTDDTPKVACRTPTPGRTGVTHIPLWRFDLIRHAILQVIGPGQVPFAALPALVAARLDPADKARLGSVNWNVTTVKLEMEVRKEVIRLPGRGAQQLCLAEGLFK